MKLLNPFVLFRIILGLALCVIALMLPYRARFHYERIVAFFVHLPFVVFGRVAGKLIRELGLDKELRRDPRG